MVSQSELAHRFTFGSNLLSPRLPESALFGEMPRDEKTMAEIARKLLQAERENQANQQRDHAENVRVLNEIEYSVASLGNMVDRGFETLESSIRQLESSLCADLGEVKWVLAQLDDKFAELLHVVTFPRETEAAELVTDGLKAFRANNMDDAEHCFKEAIEKKRTSFQGCMNLALVCLHKGNAEDAISHFKKAADYAPVSEQDELDILALENLARAYFASRDYLSAYETITKAIHIREERGKENLKSYYHSATYAACRGHEDVVELILAICKQDASYFARAAKDEDFAKIRSRLLPALEELASSENSEARTSLAKTKAQLNTVRGSFGEDIPPEGMGVIELLSNLESSTADVQSLLDKEDYSHSIEAKREIARIEYGSILVEGYHKPLRALAELRARLPALEAKAVQAEDVVDDLRVSYGAELRALNKREEKLAWFLWTFGMACFALVGTYLWKVESEFIEFSALGVEFGSLIAIIAGVGCLAGIANVSRLGIRRHRMIVSNLKARVDSAAAFRYEVTNELLRAFAQEPKLVEKLPQGVPPPPPPTPGTPSK